MTSVLDLPQVTLCCVDTRQPALAVAAMQRCMAGIRFGRRILFTDGDALGTLPPGIEGLPLRIESAAGYSAFLLRGLLPHIATSHVLIVQWDGYVLDPGLWQAAFLQFDYIGAPWHDVPGDAGVGNGGFSLRSRRLLQALQHHAITPSHPEDTCICRAHRTALEQVHDIKFAPREIAARFAFERETPAAATFGFHGLFNFHHVMQSEPLNRLLRELPDAMMGGLDAHDLCRTLIRRGGLDSAAVIVGKRRRLGMRDRRTLRLRAALAWANWRAR